MILTLVMLIFYVLMHYDVLSVQQMAGVPLACSVSCPDMFGLVYQLGYWHRKEGTQNTTPYTIKTVLPGKEGASDHPTHLIFSSHKLLMCSTRPPLSFAYSASLACNTSPSPSLHHLDYSFSSSRAQFRPYCL